MHLWVYSQYFSYDLFPFYVGLAIAIIGVIIAIYYIIKILRISFNVFSRTDGNMRNLKTFLKMHSPIIVSAMILLAMCTTILGSVHFEGGKVSIQPVSRNLIIFNSPTNNQTVDVGDLTPWTKPLKMKILV